MYILLKFYYEIFKLYKQKLLLMNYDLKISLINLNKNFKNMVI